MWRKLLGYSQETPSERPQTDDRQLADPQPAPSSPITAQVSQLTADVAGLRLEWSETLDKLGRWASRQSARDRRRVDRDLDGLAGDGPETNEDPSGATISEGLDTGSLVDRASRKAALRRRIQQHGG